jgi:capsular exopolysaccharide synthesis family protein
LAAADSTLAPSSAQQQGQNLKDYLRLLWSRKWLVLLIALLVFGGVEYLTFQQAPVYQAQARLIIPAPPPVIVNGVVQPQAKTEDFIATEAEVIASPTIASRVVQALNLKGTPSSLAHRIKVEPVPSTGILRIFTTAGNPKLAADLVNTVAKEYLTYRHSHDKAQLEVQKRLIQARIDADQQKLDDLRSQDQTDPQVISERNSLINDQNVQNGKLLDIAQAEAGIENSGSILEAATPPKSPVSPDKIRSGILGLILGLVLGAATVFIIEYFRDRMSSPAEVERFVGSSVLALVPEIKSPRKHPLLLSDDEASMPLTEALRTLRTNLQFLAKRDDVRAIVVTSPALGDGKTVVSSNLAIAMTQVGNRVVLIDGDLRRPRLHGAFGVPIAPGLSSILVGESTLESAVAKSTVPNLRLIPSGPIPAQPTELLGSSEMADVVQRCREASDFVIIDSPPVIGLADPSVLASYADGVLLVINQEAGRRALTQARTQLERVGARILGIVVNKVQATRRGYYYYDYYYPYYEDKPGKDGHKRRPSRKSPLRDRL